jgi:hypothetical protein
MDNLEAQQVDHTPMMQQYLRIPWKGFLNQQLKRPAHLCFPKNFHQNLSISAPSLTELQSKWQGAARTALR